MRSIRIRLCCAALSAAVAMQASAQVNHSTLALRSGTWTYGGIPGGSEALFSDAARQSLASISCIRATRRIAISARSIPGTSLLLWTASAQRSLPATYNAATGFVTAELPASDQLLDALSFSRGRFSVTVQGSAPLVLPNWPEPTRAIEDCRN